MVKRHNQKNKAISYAQERRYVSRVNKHIHTKPLHALIAATETHAYKTIKASVKHTLKGYVITLSNGVVLPPMAHLDSIINNKYLTADGLVYIHL